MIFPQSNPLTPVAAVIFELSADWREVSSEQRLQIFVCFSHKAFTASEDFIYSAQAICGLLDRQIWYFYEAFS